MAEKINIGVVFGGRSSEHEVAVRSARAVIDALDREKYTVVPLAITREGHWLSPAEAARLLPDETRRLLSPEVAEAAEPVAIIGDPSRQGLSRLEASRAQRRPLDVVFPVLHGPCGGDGPIQGLFEVPGLPYVGSRVVG